MLEEAGLIEQKEGRLELTPKGLRAIGSNALRDLFSKLTKDKIGQHQLPRSARATSARTTPSPTSTAIRSSSTCTARSATPCSGAPVARRHAGALDPTTSRSSAPSTSPGRPPC